MHHCRISVSTLTPLAASRRPVRCSTIRERSRCSISRAILAVSAIREGGVYDSLCFEMDIGEQNEKTLPGGKRHGEIFVPFVISMRAGSEPEAVDAFINSERLIVNRLGESLKVTQRRVLFDGGGLRRVFTICTLFR